MEDGLVEVDTGTLEDTGPETGYLHSEEDSIHQIHPPLTGSDD